MTDNKESKKGVCMEFVKEMVRMPVSKYDTSEVYSKTITRLARKFKYVPGKAELMAAYTELNARDPTKYAIIPELSYAFTKKAVRSDSGILNVSVSTPPDKFSCKYNCYFCPNEPGMPRSYLSNEDVFSRAAEVGFDTVRQVYSRLDMLEKNGHTIDKLEFRVLGGTFSCYDHAVADEFIRDLYYAANTFYTRSGRDRGTIEQEQEINETAEVHVVGLGVETRPDEINEAEVIRFRRYGVTRVEMGVQHTDDKLLRKVNRGHKVADSRRAVRLLKDYGFKVEIHIMADLPGATPEGDKECYREVLQGEDLIPDYMKDYPCLDVSYTEIKKWKGTNKWQPYAEISADGRELKDVLIYRQSITPPWVRVNRVQRDFKKTAENYTDLGYTSDTIYPNLAQIVKDEAEDRGIYCQCIRCSEIHREKFRPEEVVYEPLKFVASGATEYFIRAIVPRSPRPLLLGFIRLRMGHALLDSIIPELRGNTAMIRELHVYGSINKVGSGHHRGAQHMGIGRRLLTMAEEIASNYGYTKMAVISGIGVRDYYRKNGYERSGSYMMKTLASKMPWYDRVAIVISLLVLMVMLFYSS